MIVLKRLSIAVLAGALVVAMTMQTVWPAWAAAMRATSATVTIAADNQGDPAAPCKAITPICIDHVGCVTAIAVPESPVAIGVPVRWSSVRYVLVAPHISGRAVEPELFPPILAV